VIRFLEDHLEAIVAVFVIVATVAVVVLTMAVFVKETPSPVYLQCFHDDGQPCACPVEGGE